MKQVCGGRDGEGLWGWDDDYKIAVECIIYVALWIKNE